MLQLSANNPDQELADEILEIDYQGEPFDIVFNVLYLLDVLNVLPEASVKLAFTDAKTSLIIESSIDTHSQYIVMPLFL